MTDAVRLDVNLQQDLAQRVRDAVMRQSTTFSDLTRAALDHYVPRAVVAREAPVYSFDGRGPSMVRDAWRARFELDADAENRLTAFRQWHGDYSASFAAATTSNAGAVIPPGYRPELYVTQVMQDRALSDAATFVQISSPTPFTIPAYTSSTGMSADHVQGTNPTVGTVTIGSKTVTPGAISGGFQVTREIADSSNPAIDAIAMSAMQESYREQTEVKVYTELNGANGQAGTITSGSVPSGAQVSTVAIAGAGAALRTALKAALAKYPFVRSIKARTALVSAEAAGALSDVLDERTGDDTAYWRPMGVAVNPAAAMTGNTATDADVFILSTGDLYRWESPVLSFRFMERAGPAFVDLALFGYFATRLLRPVGLAAIRYA